MKPFQKLHAFVLAAALWAGAGVADTLPRPASLEPAVDFWIRVYTEVDSGAGVIHDDRRLDIVYEVLRFPEGSSRRHQGRLMRAAKERWRQTLLDLAAGTAPATAQARRAAAAWGDASPATLRRAARRLRFQRGLSDRFKAGLERAGAYEGFVRRTLRRHGLPEELAALPHVESSYNPVAHSHASAVGMWQFTRPTGRRFMRIDHVVDERLDPYKSTEAAARLLRHNHDVTGSWPLAITAYNHGSAGMRRAVRKVGTRDIGAIVARYDGRLFGFASRNFYVSFLAALEVSREAERYFGPIQRHPPQELERVEVPAYLEPGHLARAVGVDVATLRQLNPDLLEPVWNGKKFVPRGYRLRLPRGTLDAAAQRRLQETAVVYGQPRQRPDRFYRVQPGDSLWVIARRYDTSVAELMTFNRLGSAHRIRAGEVLRLPVDEARTAALDTAPAGDYRVRPGDTLGAIARRAGTTPAELAALNGIRDPRRLRAGQLLRLATAPAAAPEEGAGDDGEGGTERVNVTYRVRPGDTLGAIARRAGTTPAELAALNGIRDPRRLRPGQDLRLAAAPEDEPADDAGEEAAPPAPPRAEEAPRDEGPVVLADGDSLEGEADAGAAPELLADPSDYRVDQGGVITVQAAETLGHYAEWAGVRASALRRLNGLRYGRPLPLGQRLRIDLSRVDAETFETRRVDYHRGLQSAYFVDNHIQGECSHPLRPGESLWTLATRVYGVPLWLLRQYNPDIDFHGVLPPGTPVRVPVVRAEGAEAGAGEDCRRA